MRAFATGVLGALLSGPAAAYCGLESCPRSPQQAGDGWSLSGGVDVRQTSFEYLRLGGDYTEVAPRADLAVGPLRLGAVAPLVTLRFLGETRTGAGNPLFAAEGRILDGGRGGVALGCQYEAPLGDADEGIADDHSMLMPYARADVGARGVRIVAQVGYRFTASEGGSGEAASAAPPAGARLARLRFHAGHDHAAPRLVNPHDDRELLWRTTWSAARPLLRTHPSVQVAAAHVVGSEGGERHFVEGGAGLRVPFGRSISLETGASVPLSAAERYRWRLTAALRLR
jgi:hypothetical protein